MSAGDVGDQRRSVGCRARGASTPSSTTRDSPVPCFQQLQLRKWVVDLEIVGYARPKKRPGMESSRRNPKKKNRRLRECVLGAAGTPQGNKNVLHCKGQERAVPSGPLILSLYKGENPACSTRKVSEEILPFDCGSEEVFHSLGKQQQSPDAASPVPRTNSPSTDCPPFHQAIPQCNINLLCSVKGHH